MSCPQISEQFIHAGAGAGAGAGAERQPCLWVGAGVSTLLLQSLFSAELLGLFCSVGLDGGHSAQCRQAQVPNDPCPVGWTS